MKSQNETGFSSLSGVVPSAKRLGTKTDVSRLSRRSFLAKGEAMLLLAVWLFAVGRIGFAESYPNRPTAGEMDEVVALGTECAKGVNERCWAAQTNQTQYPVAPFTNNSCWYLDQSLMGTMASKIRSLVPYYADPDTVYNGTTNMAMLSVTSLWVKLDIGNHTNQFTQTFASGTNAVVYGDSPWRTCSENLDERYNVLEALKLTRRINSIVATNVAYRYPPNRNDFAYNDINGYYAIATDWLATDWINGSCPLGYSIGAGCDNISPNTWTMSRGRGKVIVNSGWVTTNVPVDTFQIFLNTRLGDGGSWTNIYFSDDGMGTEPNSILLKTYSGEDDPWNYVSGYIGNKETIVSLGSGFPAVFANAWLAKDISVITKWSFQYCPDE